MAPAGSSRRHMKGEEDDDDDDDDSSYHTYHSGVSTVASSPSGEARQAAVAEQDGRSSLRSSSTRDNIDSAQPVKAEPSGNQVSSATGHSPAPAAAPAAAIQPLSERIRSKLPPDVQKADLSAAKAAQGGGRVRFPWKLHQLLAECEASGDSDVIAWLPCGTAFRVFDKDVFTNRVMPRFFHSTKYKTFQRSLNVWGFECVVQGADKGAVYHQFFRKGRLDLCRRMVRQGIKDPTCPTAVAAAAAASGKQKHGKEGDKEDEEDGVADDAMDVSSSGNNPSSRRASSSSLVTPPAAISSGFAGHGSGIGVRQKARGPPYGGPLTPPPIFQPQQQPPPPVAFQNPAPSLNPFMAPGATQPAWAGAFFSGQPHQQGQQFPSLDLILRAAVQNGSMPAPPQSAPSGPLPSVSSSSSTGLRDLPEQSSFAERLHAALEDPSVSCLSWRPHGRCFEVSSQGKFDRTVLSDVLKLDSYDALEAALDSHGVCKIRNGKDSGCFYHDLLVRGLPHLPRRRMRTPEDARMFPSDMVEVEKADFYGKTSASHSSDDKSEKANEKGDSIRSARDSTRSAPSPIPPLSTPSTTTSMQQQQQQQRPQAQQPNPLGGLQALLGQFSAPQTQQQPAQPPAAAGLAAVLQQLQQQQQPPSFGGQQTQQPAMAAVMSLIQQVQQQQQQSQTQNVALALLQQLQQQQQQPQQPAPQQMLPGAQSLLAQLSAMQQSRPSGGNNSNNNSSSGSGRGISSRTDTRTGPDTGSGRNNNNSSKSNTNDPNALLSMFLRK